ncbi:MAG: putative Ig domain-containing protein [Planctomycetes bacterium]|nr:putative Ig domain-containing protein [Planctomycetota bacterium]
MSRKMSLAAIPLLLSLIAGCMGNGMGSGEGRSAPKPIPTITTTSLPRATRGNAYSTQLVATTPAGTDPVEWALAAGSTPLPTGLVLQGDGNLSGTPTVSGLFEMRFRASNSVGGSVEAALDIVVYEPTGYTHMPDMFDTPANNSFATATNLGALTMAAPIVQLAPLSVTSDPADPNTDARDYFSFTTGVRGRIQIEVFFDYRTGGKLFAFLGGEHYGAFEDKVNGAAIANGDDSIMVLDDAPAGVWFLKVEAQFKNGGWNSNGYTFRITFNDITITSGLIEHDLAAAGAISRQLQASVAGMPVGTGTWSQVSGALPAGVSLASDGTLSGTPGQTGLFDAGFSVEFNGYATSRDVRIRVYDSGTGDYWLRFGEHRYYDAARTNGDGEYHEHYSEATVVAPHPDYGTEGAIYVIGGRVTDTVNTVYVFHTAHQGNSALEYKLEDIGRPLATERQYLGAVYLQHTYGGYIYVVGGELYSNTAPSSGDFTRVVERMQVADGSGVALSTPGVWQPVAELPADVGGRAIKGWAEMAVVGDDAAVDADDRIYLLAGRIQVESSPGSGTYGREENDAVLMYEVPTGAVGLGGWYRKLDTTPYTPRRFPAAGMINGRIYLVGGTGAVGTLDTIEMYQPDPTGNNAALGTLGSSSFPTLAEPAYYSAAAVHNGTLYVLNGWKFQGFSPVATSRLQAFTPNAGGTGGSMNQLAVPDNGSGYHSAVFHDGQLWFITGRDSFVQTPHYSLRYTP